MKHRYARLQQLSFCSLLLFTLLSFACDKDDKSLSTAEGTYTGTATINEQLFVDDVLIYDTSFTTTDELIVTTLDADDRLYHVELNSNYRNYNDEEPLLFGEYQLDKFNRHWHGFDDYGATVDNKRDWRFDPQQDTVYFRLLHFPYGPTLIDDPDSIGHYTAVIHIWDYVLKAER